MVATRRRAATAPRARWSAESIAGSRGSEAGAFLVKVQAATVNPRGPRKCHRRKTLHPVGNAALLEIPPRPRFGLGILVRAQRSDLLLRKRHVVKPGIIDGAHEKAIADRRAGMPQPHENLTVISKAFQLADFIRAHLVAVAIQRNPPAAIRDGDLHNFGAVSALGGK